MWTVSAKAFWSEALDERSQLDLHHLLKHASSDRKYQYVKNANKCLDIKRIHDSKAKMSVDKRKTIVAKNAYGMAYEL